MNFEWKGENSCIFGKGCLITQERINKTDFGDSSKIWKIEGKRQVNFIIGALVV